MTIPLSPDFPPAGIEPSFGQQPPASLFQSPGITLAGLLAKADQSPQADADDPMAGQPEPRGPWLDDPEPEVAKAIQADIEAREPYERNRHEWRKRNRAWVMGSRFGKLHMEQVNNFAQYRYVEYGPAQTDAAPFLPNKTADLCRKTTQQVLADPPQPDAEPRTGNTDDIESATFATRFLKADGDAARSNDARKLEKAVYAALQDNAAYVYVYADPTKGGWQPKAIMAAPQATDPQNPTLVPGPAPLNPDGSPVVGPDGQPMAAPMVPYVGDLVRRYVDEGLTRFVESADEAGRQWEAGFCVENVDASRVRLFPVTADTIEECEYVILLLLAPFATLERRFEAVRQLDDAAASALVAWEPPRATDLLDLDLRIERANSRIMATDEKRKGRPSPNALCWYYAAYRIASPEYPKGAYVYGNATTVFARGEQAGTYDLPDGTRRVQLLDLPVAGCRPMEQGAVVEWFAPTEEFTARIFAGVLEAVDQALHPHIYVTATSPIQPEQFLLRDGVPKRVLSRDDVPQTEEPRQLPSLAMDVVEFMQAQQDNASGLRETAQGGEVGNVNSGVQVMAITELARQALGGVFRASLACIQRLWRIKLQQARVKFTVPQRIRYVGEDGSATEEWFRGADLHGVEDVAIARGSGTMMSPSQKVQQVMSLAQSGVQVDPLDVTAFALNNVSPVIGLQDNPHRQRIARQVKQWMDLIPAAMQGQMPPASPFDARLVDTEPAVAAWRLRELGKVMASTAYSEAPPPLRQMLDAEYTRMVQAMTPPPQNAGPNGPPQEPGAAPPPPFGGAQPPSPPAGAPPSASPDMAMA